MKTIKKNKWRKPRKLSLVKFDFEGLPKKYWTQYPFQPNESYLFLGEIPNMNGHCVIGNPDGTVQFGWHTNNFIELTDDET